MDDQPKPPVRYESYLMRLRWVERDGRPTCQAMLQSVASKEQRYFADLEDMVAFLQAQSPGQSMANPATQTRKEETMRAKTSNAPPTIDTTPTEQI